MKILRYKFFLKTILLSLTICAQNKHHLKISVIPLTKEIYVHVSYKILDEKPFPSNGLIINTADDVVLVDAAWDNSQTEQLLKWINSKLTADRAEKDGFPRPESIVPLSDSSFRIGKTNIETFYPGKGHSPDNIVVWLPDQKILFGGCLVKSTESEGLGNIADASLGEWPATIQKLVKKYSEASLVIPGHLGWK